MRGQAEGPGSREIGDVTSDMHTACRDRGICDHQRGRPRVGVLPDITGNAIVKLTHGPDCIVVGLLRLPRQTRIRHTLCERGDG